MRVIPPYDVTTSMLTSSSAPDPLTSPVPWVSGTTYAKGDFADDFDQQIYVSLVGSNLGNQPSHSPKHWAPIGYQEDAWSNATTYNSLTTTVGYNHRVYRNLQASNTNNSPLNSPTWWEDIGAVNRWRCFDYTTGSKSYSPSPYTIVLTPGQVTNSLALLGLEADDLTISVSSVLGGGVVYSATVDLSTRFPSDWYEWLTTAFSTSEGEVVFDIPPFPDNVITVTLTRDPGNGAVGVRSVVIGLFQDIGRVQHGAESDALNFSTIDRDIFGVATLVQRRSIPKIAVEVWADADQTDKIRALRVAANAVPMVFSGLDDSNQPYSEALLLLGVYKRWTINLAYADKCVSTIEVEEI